MKEEEEEFDTWYANYPHKVGKGQARKAFKTARRKASLEQLVDGVTRYMATKLPDIRWCNPATFLNGERWLDEPAKNGGAIGTTGNVISAADNLVSQLRMFDEPAGHICGGKGTPAVRAIPKR